jgi:hypothetical protein
MAKPWDSLVIAATVEPIRHKRGLLGGCDAYTGSEALVGMLQTR